jgi:hypothetical protein
MGEVASQLGRYHSVGETCISIFRVDDGFIFERQKINSSEALIYAKIHSIRSQKAYISPLHPLNLLIFKMYSAKLICN